jgi:hypothetical protein
MHLEVAPWDRPSSAKAEPGNPDSPPGTAWRLERTYIHAADPQARVDDILCQLVYLDGQGQPSSNPVILYTLSDVNGNVVALADGQGRLAAQYTYEPDGRLRSAEIPAAPATGPPPAPGEWPATIAAARLNRLGFQGLWAERIDVEGATTDTPTAGLDPLGISDATAWPAAPGPIPLLGGSPRDTHEVLYFARNRFYSPSLNRWTHADPNALGVPVLGSLWWNGGTPTPPAAHFDLTSHYADGLNTHAAYRGDPLGQQDPTGLFAAATLGAAAQVLPGPSDFIRSALQSLVGEYSSRLEWDAESASDWALPDDAYSRTDSKWVIAAIGRGLKDAFDVDIPFTDISVNPLDSLASSSIRGSARRVGNVHGRVPRHTHTIRDGQWAVYVFQHPNYRDPFIRFNQAAIRDTINITPQGNSKLYTRHANKVRGKPKDYDWSSEYGEPHTWHHDNVRGRMYLVPTRLRRRVNPHVGGGKTWYE